MLKEIIKGILFEHQNKLLNTKRINELTTRIVVAVQMVRGADSPPHQTEDEQIKEKVAEEVRVEVKTITSAKGNKAIISVPEESKKKKSEVKAIIAYPVGSLGHGTYEGKNIEDDVAPFKIEKKNG